MNLSDSVLKCDDAVSLRVPELLDAESLAKYANDRSVWINLRDSMPHPYSVADAIDWLARIQHQDRRTNFIIDLKVEAIGTIGLVLGKDVERCAAEVGYWLGAEHRGAVSRRWRLSASVAMRSRSWGS